MSAGDGNETPRGGGKLRAGAGDVETVEATASERDGYDPSHRIGQVIAGKYVLESLIGQGGMGTVFAAKHVSLPRRYAVKLLRAERSWDGTALKRFEREAYEAAAIRHPAIIDVLDFGTHDDGVVYIVMELLEGTPVDALLARGPLPLRQAVDIAIGALDALEVAHQRGLVHRDIKPENLFLARAESGREQLKVLDFGIAKVGGGESQLTAAGLFMGTPAYMSLEQVRDSADVDLRADVYSVGATLFHLLTGELPVGGASLQALMSQVLEDRVERDPRLARPDTPAWLAEVVIKAMARAPADRYEAARAMRLALEARRDELAADKISVRVGTSEPPRSDTAFEDVSIADTIDAVPGPPGRTEAMPGSPFAHEAGADVPASVTLKELDRQRQRRLVARAAAGTLVAVGALAVVLSLLHERPNEATGSSTTAVAPAATVAASPVAPSVGASAPPPPASPAGMVYMSGGRLLMGSQPAEIDAARRWCQEQVGQLKQGQPGAGACERLTREAPAHEVELSPFFIDRHEVTNAAFARWLATVEDLTRTDHEFGTRLEQGGLPLVVVGGQLAGIDVAGEGYRVTPGEEETPVRYVSWHGAQRFCQDDGRRLPTEAEWELTARGHERRAFPWGDEPPSCAGVVFARYRDMACANLPHGPARVGYAAADVTPEGVHDLAGNLREWVHDPFVESYTPCDPICRDPGLQPSAPAARYAIRGGGWLQPAVLGRAARRGGDEPGWTDVTVGFRCARSADSGEQAPRPLP